MPDRRSRSKRRAAPKRRAAFTPPAVPPAGRSSPAPVWLRYASRFAVGGHYALAIFTALLFCLPVYWGLIASLRQTGLPPATSIEWWPLAPAWENYRRIFDIVPLARYLGNSLLVTAIAAPVTVLMASLAGFGMSQIDDENTRRSLIRFNVVALMIPASAVWILRFQILSFLGLIDSLGALILPAFAASSPLFVLLFYWAFRQIPEEMFEAARLDGAGPWMLWRLMAMPLARPTITGVTVLTFWLYWSDFINPVLFIYNPQNYTLAIGVEIIKQMDLTNTPLLMAAAMFMAAPVLALFMFLQRFFLHEMSLANLFERN